MSLQNLSEDFLYDLLPEGVISLDEQGLIQAVVGGYQDRVDDLRSYISKFEMLMTGNGLPEVDNAGNAVDNVILCQIQSPQGKIYNRSLDIHDDTPADGSPDLFIWARDQLQLDEDHVLLGASYGVDMLRLVDANILASLAATVGAVLYQTAAMDPNQSQSDARRLLNTWFPRLQFKGTAQSFESLGRLLGFDDVRMTPLFGRLSPRIANDTGDPDNDQDFSVIPDYYPKQVRDNFYNPWVLNDGPFYTWSGTATARLGTNSTDFYTQVLNGFNPFVTVTQVSTNPQDPDPTGSPYILVGGGPESPASVSPPNSGLMFKAISAGSSFNGLQINFEAIQNGTYRIVSITDRLSAIKYRTSFYNLALTMDFGKALERFGTNVASPNKDLAANPSFTNFGSLALSPFRPWTSGSIRPPTFTTDWITETVAGTLTVIAPRSQATLADREFDIQAMSAAGAQVVQAMEEVRPASRTPRQINVGFLIHDQTGYASYCAEHSLFTTTASKGTYFGTLTGFPLTPYSVEFLSGTATGTLPLVGETDLVNSGFVRFRSTDLIVSGTFDYSNATWLFAFNPVTTGTNVISAFVPTSTEVIRSNPGSNCPEIGYQIRPEDRLDAVSNDFADEYPWRRDLVGGGELVDYDVYAPAQPDLEIVNVGDTTAVFNQTGAQFDVQVIVPGPYPPRFITAERSLDHYVPGQCAIAYTGTFRDLSQGTITPPVPPATPNLRITNDGNMRIIQSGSARIIEGTTAAGSSMSSVAGGLDSVMFPGWKIYHFGLVQGILVADPTKFYGDHHRTGLALWYPFNEQPLDAIEVLDHSVFDGRAFINGLNPDDRNFDPVRGNYLSAQPGLALNSPLARGFGQTFSGGFWLRCLNDYSTEETILVSGPLQIALAGAAPTPQVKFYLTRTDGTKQLQATQAFNQGWVYVAWNFEGQTLTINFWNSAGTLTQQTISVASLLDFATPYHFSLLCTSTSFDIQDLRLWNVNKNSSQLALARYHNPNPTMVLYRPSWLQSANTYDHYAVRVLPSGYLAPDRLPTSIITNRQAWVDRYDDLGRYDAQSRYKETGIGSGNTLPALQPLGAQWDNLTADGTLAISTQAGNFVGWNKIWADNSPQGTYIALHQAGSTTNGFTDVPTLSGTNNPWPNPLVATNPCRDRVWVKGDDGFVWQVMLNNTEGTVTFETEKLYSLTGSYQPTGNVSLLEGSNETSGITNVAFDSGNVLTVVVVNHTNATILGNRFSFNLTSFGVSNVTAGNTSSVLSVVPGSSGAWFFTLDGVTIYSEPSVSRSTTVTYTFGGSGQTKLSVNNSGIVFAGSFNGSINTGPLYLYSTRETLVSLSGTKTIDAWVQPNTFGLNQIPPVPALNKNGQIAFQVDAPIPTGFYRLEVTSGNIGKVDSSFAGFNTVATVGDIAFQAVLCKGQTGADFNQTDTFDFFVSQPLPGAPSSWLLSFDWTNYLKDQTKGTVRNLFISDVKVTRFHSSLYKVSTGDTVIGLTKMDTSGASYGTTPGGWLGVMTSWGTVDYYAHESTVYSADDTVADPEPLSNKLGATTMYRREDVIMNGSFTVHDIPIPSLAVYGTVSVT